MSIVFINIPSGDDSSRLVYHGWHTHRLITPTERVCPCLHWRLAQAHGIW